MPIRGNSGNPRPTVMAVREPRRLLDQIQIPGAGYSLGAATRLQLAVEVVDVGLDRTQRDEEATCDLPVGLAGGDKPEHLQLALAQRLREPFAGTWCSTFLCEKGQQLREIARRDLGCGVGVAPLAGFDGRRQKFAHRGSLVHEGTEV